MRRVCILGHTYSLNTRTRTHATQLLILISSLADRAASLAQRIERPTHLVDAALSPMYPSLPVVVLFAPDLLAVLIVVALLILTTSVCVCVSLLITPTSLA